MATPKCGVNSHTQGLGLYMTFFSPKIDNSTSVCFLKFKIGTVPWQSVVTTLDVCIKHLRLAKVS